MASSYKLSILISLVAVSLLVFASSHAFGQTVNPKIPVIILFKDQPSSDEIKSFKDLSQVARLHVPDKMNLVKSHGGDIKRSWNIINGFEADIPQDQMEGLKNDPSVASLEPVITLSLVDTNSATQIRANQDWNLGYTGKNVAVAILDTGIDTTHQEFNGRIIGCHNELTQTDTCIPFAGRGGHGTHVAGILAGSGVDGAAKGVAPSASLLMDVVCDLDGCKTPDMISGINWAYNNHAKIISMSIGKNPPSPPDTTTQANCDSLSPSFTAAVNHVVAGGVTVVIAAGNLGSAGMSFPGCVSSVITVGAVNSTNYIAGFSGLGGAMTDHGITAPGVGIYSAWPSANNNDYAYLSGTSMATPHVAGVIALMLEAHPTLTPDDIKVLIFNTACTSTTNPACPTGTVPNSQYGHGIVDSFRASSTLMPISLRAGVLNNDVTGRDITPGTLVHAAVTLQNPVGTPTGTVSYLRYSGTLDCVPSTPPPVQNVVGETVTLNPNGTVPPSSIFTSTGAGDWSYQAAYSGDANNHPTWSPCTPVKFIHSLKISTSVTSGPLSTGPDVTFQVVSPGTIIRDHATLSLPVGGVTPTGSLTYQFYTDGTCSGVHSDQIVNLNPDGTVPTSNPITGNPVGVTSYKAIYNGDSYYISATAPCEIVFFYYKLTLTTAIKDKLNNDVTGKTVSLGTPVHDTATLSFPIGLPAPDGRVDYQIYDNHDCIYPFDTKFVTPNPDGTVPPTDFINKTSPGSISYRVIANGGSNYATGTPSPCQFVTFANLPAITLNPSSGPVGTIVTVTGTNYPASSTVGITYNGTVVATTPAPITTNATGGFLATFAAPSSTPGPHTVNASSGTSKAGTTFTLTPTTSIITVMSDTTASFDSLISSSRPFIGEYVSPTSALVGKQIDSITLRMAKVGAPTGTAQVGIFDINRNVVKLFGTVDVSTISTTDTVYEFKLPATDLYTIAYGDRIGFAYTGGSSTVGVNVTPDRVAGDPFDGANSYRVRYETAWITSTTEDMYMILKQTHAPVIDNIPPVITATPAGGTYNYTQLVTLSTNEQAKIYYTTNGTNPTSFGRIYNSPIPIATSTTLKYYGVDTAGNPSSVVTQNYVILPAIKLNPTSGPVGTILNVTGTNFRSPPNIKIQYDGQNVITNPTTVTANTTGGFSATFTAPSSTLGPHTVSADSGGGLHAQDTFTVTLPLHTTTTAITPNPSQVATSSHILYNATITDTSATPTAPTGSVTFSDGGKGGSFTACTLVSGTGKSTCSTTYTSPSVAGPETINGTYPGDATHQKSSGTSALTVTSSAFPIIQMSDTTISFDSLISSARPFIGEYASPTSALVGKPIDSITLRMAKVGAPTGTAQVGVFDINRNVVKLFATVDVSTISTTDTVYEFKLPATDLYIIASGDRIGFKYTGGSSSVGVNVTPDRVAGDPFDGTNSYRVRYETAWITSSSEDMYMILKQTHG